MDQHVTRIVRDLRKRPVADRARVRLLSGMHAQVQLEVVRQTESLAAELALEVLLSDVHANMFLQIRHLVERLVAHLAPVWLLAGVDPQVVLQAVGPDEGLVADRAPVRLLPGVDPDVVLQVARLLEGLSAELARVRPLLRVTLEVVHETAKTLERLAAPLTSVRLLLVMHDHVILKIFLGRHGPPTDVAGVRFICRILIDSLAIKAIRSRSRNTRFLRFTFWQIFCRILCVYCADCFTKNVAILNSVIRL